VTQPTNEFEIGVILIVWLLILIAGLIPMIGRRR
jgi:hypothetical protein